MITKILVCLCTLLLTTTLMAQEEEEELPIRKGTYEYMTKKMVKKLHLNEKQLKKVEKLNKKYKKLIEGEHAMPPGGNRPDMGGDMPDGDPMEENGMPDHHGGGMHRGRQSMGGMPMGGGMSGGGPMGGGIPGGGPMGGGGMHRGGPMGFPGNPHESSYDYDKQQKKYDKALKKILTEDQYEGYQHELREQFVSQRRIRDFLLGDE